MPAFCPAERPARAEARRSDLDSGAVVSCSALKRRYRDRLTSAAPRVFFLHLDGELCTEQSGRHVVAPSLGDPCGDQLGRADLEPLGDDESGAAVPIDGTPQETAALAHAAVTGREGEAL
jgi:gluconokinase